MNGRINQRFLRGHLVKYISRLYQYDDEFLAGKIPDEAIVAIPNMEHDIPVFIEHAFLSDDQCDRIIESFLRNGPGGTSAATEVSNNTVRRSYHFDLNGDEKAIYNQAVQRIKCKIGDFYSVVLKGSDGAHGLGYGPGCKYNLHADNCDPVLDDAGEIQYFGITFPHRQISMILFLTDSVIELTGKYQHIGGNISFNLITDHNHDCVLIEPRKGCLVAFPSHPVFSHEVHEVYEVSDGYRFVIVDWYNARRASGNI